MNQVIETTGAKGASVDVFEKLFDDGAIGCMKEVSKGLDEIVRIRGILFDVDPDLFRPDGIVSGATGLSPAEFFEQHVAKWLERHPILQKAEVRCSGRGIHVILRLQKPIELRDEVERRRWDLRIKIIQSALPSDHRQRGMCGKTRALGSINSKNNGLVSLLKAGTGVTETELLQLVDDLINRPFRHYSQVLLGPGEVLCPICNVGRLVSGDRAGDCYKCGEVSLDMLLKHVFASDCKAKGSSKAATSDAKEVAHAA